MYIAYWFAYLILFYVRSVVARLLLFFIYRGGFVYTEINVVVGMQIDVIAWFVNIKQNLIDLHSTAVSIRTLPTQLLSYFTPVLDQFFFFRLFLNVRCPKIKAI